MKKIILIGMILLLFSTKTTAYTEESELEQLASIVMDNKLDISSWQVVNKEKLTKNKLELMLETLKSKYTYNTEENKQIIKYSFRGNIEKEMNIFYEIIIPKNNQEKGQLVVTVKGTTLNEKTLLNYKNIINPIKDLYFTPFVKVYTCLNTNNNDIIKTVDFLSNLGQQLELIHTFSQTDKVEQSPHEKIIYGYTPLWNQKIQVDERLINIQIAIKRTDNEQFNFLIGTPILINEY